VTTSPTPSETLRATLAPAPVVAILRARTATHFVAGAQALAEAGVRAVEVTLTTDGALDALRELRAARPGLLAGVGTVITPEEAAAAVEAGAQFLVAPCVRADTLAAATRLGVPMLPGAFTPTEVVAAVEHGAALVKLFPATLGPAYLKALRGPLPQVGFVPTGGIGTDAIRPFLDAGAVAVGLGSPLTGDSLETGDLEALTARAREAVAAATGDR
jgi:2-dehydro-3-deoxyphosphogluconate aldolase / (4S)-4-hydroxy-2-oxoglutarate aldolase